ncbi:MAG: hypothetical protein WAT58_02575 [Candidatus Dormiibacterota bacterium]
MGALETTDRELHPEVELHPQMRDVLAWAGTAVMWGQMLESTLATFASLETGHEPADSHRFRQFFRGAGSNAGPARPKPAHSSPRHLYLANDLEKSIRRRDFLIHSFFRSKNCQRLLQTEPGRRALVGELRGLADEFKGWADALAPVVLAYAVARGLTTRAQLMARVEALGLADDPQQSELASQAQAALDLDAEKVEQMVQVLRELESRRQK